MLGQIIHRMLHACDRLTATLTVRLMLVDDGRVSMPGRGLIAAIHHLGETGVLSLHRRILPHGQ